MMRKVLAILTILCSISLGAWADAAAEIDHLARVHRQLPVPLRAQR
jgi:hypothetical protein